jgi:hypothetical protein
MKLIMKAAYLDMILVPARRVDPEVLWDDIMQAFRIYAAHHPISEESAHNCSISYVILLCNPEFRLQL